MNLFISELSGAVFQVLLFALIPFVWRLISAKKKTNFFEWIGLKKIRHEGKWLHTILITVVVVSVYGILTTVLMKMYSGGITAAGSNFAGMGITAIPAAMVYGYVRTGLSEELFFRGFLLKRVSSKCGFVVGNTVQALLFGAMHGIPFGIATQNVVIRQRVSYSSFSQRLINTLLQAIQTFTARLINYWRCLTILLGVQT